MNGKRLLRFGVMCRGTTFPAWEARCLRHLLALEGVEAALLVVEERPAAHVSRREKVRGLLRRRTLLWAVYTRLFVDGRSEAMRPVSMARELSHLPAVRCRPLRRGTFSECFSEADIAAIRQYDLDFILRFAFGIIRGEILEVPRYGVWSFHHGDLDRYRGTPPGFWEIYHGDPVTGSVLQRLTDRLDGGVVLHRGFFRTRDFSYVRNRDAAYFGSADWPARVCKDIVQGHAAYLDGPPSQTAAPILRSPTDWQVVRFLLGTARNVLASQFRSLFRSEQWNVGVVDRPIRAFLTPEASFAVRWLPAPARRRFLADPFGVRYGDGLVVLAEDYDYRTRRGRISVLTSLDGKAFTMPRPVLERPVHLSYPYLFTWQGDVYCVPETAEAREVSLHRAVEFPEKWQKVATLVEGVAAVDPTVFRHEGWWWLFCTDGDGGDQTKLHAWHARDLPGPWSPHAANPLKTDIRSSRPAGTPFVHDGRLYRPAQDGSRAYGGAVALNRVLRLTPTEFEEELVTVVKPDPRGPYPDGLHTISAAGDLTLIDGSRRVFVLEAFWQSLRSKASRVRRWLARRPSPGASPSEA